MPHFECGAFDHSATSPKVVLGQSGPPLNVAAFRHKRDFAGDRYYGWLGLIGRSSGGGAEIGPTRALLDRLAIVFR